MTLYDLFKKEINNQEKYNFFVYFIEIMIL